VLCLALNARDVADGVAVAKSVTLKDKFENLALSLIHSHACSLIQEVAGNGTMTATMLTHAIYSKGIKNIAVGCNPMDGCHHCRGGSTAASSTHTLSPTSRRKRSGTLPLSHPHLVSLHAMMKTAPYPHLALTHLVRPCTCDGNDDGASPSPCPHPGLFAYYKHECNDCC
jgi:hypothetical protein